MEDQSMVLHSRVGIFDHLSLCLGGAQLVVARMAEYLSKSHDVEVIHGGRGYDLPGLAKAFDVDMSRARERIVNDWQDTFSLPGSRSTLSYLTTGLKADRELTSGYDLFIYSGHGVPPFSYARHAIIYCHFPFEGDPTRDPGITEALRQRLLLDRWARSAFYKYVWARRIQSYEKVLCNSEFSAEWIERLWGIRAQVLYPPVAIDIPQTEKRNLIVSIGRFVNTGTKGQALQLAAFSEFLSQVGNKWTLYMIGFCTDLPQDRAYLEQLKRIAKGLPVVFVINADRTRVLSHLAEAKLFWHTTGLAETGHASPHSLEHFGIATVEAMLGGCVPLVPAFGGQREIVEHEVNGYVCRNIAELVNYSVCVGKDDQLRIQMSRAAIRRAHAFCPAVFNERLSKSILSEETRDVRLKSCFEPAQQGK